MRRIWVGASSRQHPGADEFQAVSCSRPSLSRRVQRTQHQDRDDAETEREARPDADAFPVHRQKASAHAGAETDRPIAEQGEQHRDARVVQAAEHAGADDLRAIEDLEDGGDEPRNCTASMTRALAAASFRFEEEVDKRVGKMPTSARP